MGCNSNQMSDAFDPFDDDSHAFSQSEERSMGMYSSEMLSEQHNTMRYNLNTTLESDLFEFSAVTTNSGYSFQDPATFPDDVMFPSLQVNSDEFVKQTTIHVVLHEQLTTVYEGNDNVPVSQVEGSIHVRSSSGSPFNLVVTDEKRQIGKFQEDSTFCNWRNVGNDTFRQKKMLTVTLPAKAAKKQKIASYSCTSQLNPIPLLVKSKVQVEEHSCRVGVKIRSNPANKRALTQIAILMAVPPDIRGETVKLTRQGGVWDGMKRVVAWPAESLAPGELIEIQAQFDFVDAGQGDQKPEPKFPILVRCEGANNQFSDVELSADSSDEFQIPVNMTLTRSVLILHRKV